MISSPERIAGGFSQFSESDMSKYEQNGKVTTS